jgi:hypothetical protein
MLMRQRDAPINHDQPVSHALPLEKPSYVLVATGAARSSCRRTT